MIKEYSLPPVALSIAGSDSGGGAGIQADLKTFTLLGVYGLSVITALTAQNTLGVQEVMDVPKKFVEQQLISVFEDFSPRAVKTGMLYSQDTVEVVAEKLAHKNLPLVIDPVLAAKRGEVLLLPSARSILKEKLFPLATLVTPNLPEAVILTGHSPINTLDAIKEAAKKILDLGVKSVLIKGGHLYNVKFISQGDTTQEDEKGTKTQRHKGRENKPEFSDERLISQKKSPGSNRGRFACRIYDLFFDGNEFIIFGKEYIKTRHLHGVGCTLSAAITAYLAQGLNVLEAVEQAQEYIRHAIDHALPLGRGIGPVNPMSSGSGIRE